MGTLGSLHAGQEERRRLTHPGFETKAKKGESVLPLPTFSLNKSAGVSQWTCDSLFLIGQPAIFQPYLDHALEWDEHRTEVFVYRQEVEESSERQDVSDTVQRFRDVARIPRRPVKPICKQNSKTF